jgi:ABC-type arginine/histidine transport system permease subunit
MDARNVGGGNPFWLLFRDAYFCALLAFSLNTCAYQLEMFAGAIRNTPHGEVEAAKAMGMTRSTALRRIILPSALRRALPPLSNEVILMLQGSAIASAVTLVDSDRCGTQRLLASLRAFRSLHFCRTALPCCDLCSGWPVPSR